MVVEADGFGGHGGKWSVVSYTIVYLGIYEYSVFHTEKKSLKTQKVISLRNNLFLTVEESDKKTFNGFGSHESDGERERERKMKAN